MLTLTESFLNITMEYQGKNGYKGYEPEGGAVHQLNASVSVISREVEKQSISSYSQTVAPTTIIHGGKPSKLKLEGTLCRVDEVESYIAPLAGYRNLNTIYNVFLPCSIVSISGLSMTDGNPWIVETFKIKRNARKKEFIDYELILNRWYGVSV